MAQTLNIEPLKVIAHIHTEFNTKFGIPRQSGIVEDLRGRIVFEREYRVADALRGLDGFSHLWLIWQFSEAKQDKWSPTVRPPRLGGNARMGVFATRSPFRPNSIGLSSVRLIDIDYKSEDAPAIIVSGADLMNGTPIFDIKPYLAYTDSHPDALCGFTDNNANKMHSLQVTLPESIPPKLSNQQAEALKNTLACDPRPRYQHDDARIYGMSFCGHEVRFQATDTTITILSID